MKGVSLPVNVLIILSIGIVVLLGLISFFGGSQSGFGGIGALLRDLTGEMGNEFNGVNGRSKIDSCKKICKEAERAKMGEEFNNKENQFCNLDCHNVIDCKSLVPDICVFKKHERKKLLSLR